MPPTIRFLELVKKSGRPHSATLWTDPQHDTTFKKAIEENRVLTVKQETVGSKKDFGTVGFRREKNVSYLIFPKALPKSDSRVVGIKYDMLEQPEIKDRVGAKPVVRKKKSTPARPRQKEFSAVLRRTAVWEMPLRVLAKNKTEAKKEFQKTISTETFPESTAIVRNELRNISATSR
jgi:hypothetical protein